MEDLVHGQVISIELIQQSTEFFVKLRTNPDQHYIVVGPIKLDGVITRLTDVIEVFQVKPLLVVMECDAKQYGACTSAAFSTAG